MQVIKIIPNFAAEGMMMKRIVLCFVVMWMGGVSVLAQGQLQDSLVLVQQQVERKHDYKAFAVKTVVSVGGAYIGKTVLKALIKEERPDHTDKNSFPSGHAAMAFAAARSIDKEFRKENMWIPIAGYAAATAIGVERIVSDRHHWYDVVAGAGVGIGAAELTWWLSGKILGKKKKNIAVGTSGNTLDIVCCF